MFLEAIVLGVLQVLILRYARPGLQRTWFIATVAGTMAGRLLQFGIDMGAAHAVPITWGAPFEYAGGFAVGALVGAVMALPQALVLRHRVPGAERWIAARALAWGCALPLLLFLFGIEAALPATVKANAMILVVATFAIVAVFVGAIEGIVMHRLIRETRIPSSA
jgi:membrane protein YqaA with SNARE-associated domain